MIKRGDIVRTKDGVIACVKSDPDDTGIVHLVARPSTHVDLIDEIVDVDALIEERDELNNWTGEYRARISSLEDKLKKAEKKEPVIETKVVEKDPNPQLLARIKELERHVKRLIQR